MSLFGHGNDLNRQFIARPDSAKEDILYKWPDMTIRRLTQVTVQPDETAIFFKEGKVAGTLPQGRSTLDGALIPFLGDIVDWASGGNMYRAELYFVGTREFVSLPFGGPIDNIEDPETGLAVGLRVYGEYALTVSDPAAMILKLVGTRQASNELITDWAREQILKALRTSVVRKLTAERWPVLGIAARTADIEAALVADVQAPLTPYGLTVTRLGNVTISLKPEDEQTLKGLRKDAAYTRLAGGFREYGVGAALKGIGEGAAAGGGNGVAALGVGMGLGGIVAGLAGFRPGDVDWRLLFIAGLLGGGLLARIVSPTSFDGWTVSSLPLLALAGTLVGLGTRIAGGCTSGHGVCGVSRLSPRSIVATMTFMGVAAATVFCVRHGSAR